MLDVLVAGYGVMTRGILPHLVGTPGMSVSLISRHLTEPPHPGVRLVQEADLSAPSTASRCRPDAIIGCFEDDTASRDFWTSAPVGAAIARSGAACMEMSTLSPTWIDSWHAYVRDQGGISVECPVTGSRPGATGGTLSAFLYQSDQDARATQILDAFTRHRYTFATAGHPTRFKLIYNAWGATLLHSLTAFVPALRATLGDDFDTAARIVSSDGWMSLVCASKLDRMLEARFDDPDFALRHMVKDLNHAREIVPAPHPLLDLVHGSYAHALSVHGGDADYTAVTADAGSEQS
jgi:3-hydroxyisobutyrate dehydrogenase-like beta-hydroxyacid dehydrogenase